MSLSGSNRSSYKPVKGIRYSVGVTQRIVVQSWLSSNPGLKLNPLFKFLYFYTSVYFKTPGPETTTYPDKVSEEIFPNF